MDEKTAKIISFINMKGGVGKTTLCKELANYTSLKNKKVLLIDIDPQSNLTQALNERFQKNDGSSAPSKFGASIENIFNTKSTGYDLSKIIVKLHNNLDIVPGELETVFLERAQNTNTSNKLMDFVQDNALRTKYDYIFIDCPPTYSIYTEMAFFISDYYLVPVIPDAYSSLGVDLLERVVTDIVFNNRNTVFVGRKPKNVGVIFTRVDTTNKPQQKIYLSALSKSKIVLQNNIYIFRSQFSESNKLSTSYFDKLITDRNDSRLTNIIHRIHNEFMLRLEELDNAQNIAR